MTYSDLSAAGPHAFRTVGVGYDESRYHKLVVHDGQVQGEQQHAMPFYHAGDAANELPHVNWSPGVGSRLEVIRPEWVTIDCAALERVDHSVGPMVATPRNPLFAFESSGRCYYVDGVSLLERMLAPRAKLLPLLLSPFRELALKVRRTGDTVCLLFDGGAMKRIGTPLQGPGLLPLHDATCLAFWCSDEERLAELERCAASIAGGKELQVPRAPCKLHCLLRGVSDGCSVFVQALTHRPKDCALRDVLWRDGWRAIRLAAMGHRAAWEIAERHPAFWCAPAKGRAWPQGCGLRPLSSDEREDLLQAVRWGW